MVLLYFKQICLRGKASFTPINRKALIKGKSSEFGAGGGGGDRLNYISSEVGVSETGFAKMTLPRLRDSGAPGWRWTTANYRLESVAWPVVRL